MKKNLQFARRLSDLMKSRRLSMAALGREIDSSHVTIRNYLAGKEPRADILQKLASYFGKSVDSLLAANTSGLTEQIHNSNNKKESSAFALSAQRRLQEFTNNFKNASRVELARAQKCLTDDARRTGKADCPVLYKWQQRDLVRFPSSIRLTSPPASEAAKLLEKAALDPGQTKWHLLEAVIAACLPKECDYEELSRRISGMSFLALAYVACALTFGDKGEEFFGGHWILGEAP
jgi:transcriptional regulator with XRE-family HTH domain